MNLLITVVGPDKPGLVERISSAIADHSGNWLESRLAHLGGQFAGIVRVELPEEKERALLDALSRLRAVGLSAQAHRDVSVVPSDKRQFARIEVVGHDRPGIVRQISQALTAHHVNVEELTSWCESAPMSGEMLFHATVAVQLPGTCPAPQLQAALERIASDLMVDISLKPAGSV